MKRLLVFILLLSYLLSTTGTDVHLHYCMGKLAGWSVWKETESKECGKCGMDKTAQPGKDCCSDDAKWLKVNSDQKLSFYSFALPKVEPTDCKTLSAYDFSLAALPDQDLLPPVHAPPLKTTNGLYLLYSNFRI